MLFAARLVSTVLLLNLSALLSSPAERPTQEILIGAAADLQPLENSLQTEFLKSTGSKAVFAFAASGSLAQQIRNGAPYDLFLSANSTFVRHLSDSGYLLQDTVQVYGYGRIALWSKGGKIRSLADLTSPSLRHIAIANPTHAPYGAAAQAALRNQGLWEKLERKVVFGENVEQTYQFAESGNADAAIVGWSLVFNKGGILLPAAWHPRIAQTAAVVKASRHQEQARRFLAFLTGRQGKAVLKQFGFDLPQ